MKNINSILAVGAVAAVCGGVEAAVVVLANWDMTGESGSQASVAGTGTGVSALDVTRGAGLVASSASNSISASGWTGEPTDYFSFGFTVGAGKSVNLSTLSIGTRASGTGPGTIGLYSSTDNFSTTLATITQGNGTFVNSVISLSSLTSLTGTVEFRLMAIGTNSANGGTTSSSGTLRITNYFDGSTNSGGFFLAGEVVPAPGAVALLGLAGLVAGRRRR